ncbi:uncharacterized protein AB675_8734 [Cyphellophora attinorum]|uniref:Uncharacterized protein n=1 Tax=Cyphellophora attinorum TaxID=1664694 RepID=A0A0N0NR22_9EURO|nr:uncharacterized protein AB675_8734 [Phialophora attinorum]KPI44591.1 hypothetical protein AB675_8734 [Phialophora attinorum]
MSTDTPMADAPSTTLQPEQDFGRQQQQSEQADPSSLPQSQAQPHQPPQPISPTHNRKLSLTNDTHPPLSHPSRVQPIHPAFPQPSLLPATTEDAPNPYTLHPLTLQPFTTADLQSHNFDALIAECRDPQTGQIDKELVKKLQDETVGKIQERVRERQSKEAAIEREVNEMEKTREVERKIWMKRMGGGKAGVGVSGEEAQGGVGGGGSGVDANESGKG